ncbi:winged helix DNA-binding domain-containing protein [Nonomuraea sp. NPDC050310]|uniref:winged helix DNA-binding domain-containing protein n=1 Tax=unclassified Nonomuraea TaxID=2593643 RepID=UPI0033FA7A0C
MDPLLSRRALNRATLERQWLVRRSNLSVLDMVTHLAGLQAQTPHTWYTGLWNRIEGFTAEAASDLLASRDLVRIALQRSTIHLVTADDCLAMRPLLEPPTARMTRTTFGKKVAGAPEAELAEVGRRLVEERPMTFAELGRALHEHWPEADAHALSMYVRWLVPLVQVPPRGLWGRSGPIAHTSAESWIGREVPPMSLEEFVRRYLAAFGPASVMDMQTWSGLTRLNEVFAGMDLPRFRDENGRTLYDLPDAPRPGEDLPVPVRLMYDFDNLFLGHADRSRVIDERTAEVSAGFVRANVMWRIVLVDGFPAGDWTIAGAKGTTTLTIHQWRPIHDLDAVAAEARRLLDFLAPGDHHEIAVTDQPSRI